MARQASVQITRSNDKGFTPQRQVLAPSDVSGKLKLQVVGKDIFCPTFIYIWPRQVADKVAKYNRFGQRLSGPGLQPADFPVPEQPGAPAIDEDVKRYMHALAQPVVCLNSGKLFVSTKHFAHHYGLSTQIVGHALKHKTIAKGRSLRVATQDELKAALSNPDWRCPDKLLPFTPGKRTKHLLA